MDTTMFWSMFFANFFSSSATLAIFAISFMAMGSRKSLGSIVKDTNTSTTKRKIDVAKVTQLIKDAEGLAKQQTDLSSQAQQPSKGAAHSRWKNGLIAQMRELEDKKIEVFRKIVAEGYDPKIGVLRPSGEVEQLPMSEAIKVWEMEDAPKMPPAEPADGVVKRQPATTESGAVIPFRKPTRK